MTGTMFINDYISFDKGYGEFVLTAKAQEIIYHEKQVICSYSGSNEWAHEFFCELLDLYSGNSQYNYAIGTVRHKTEIEEMYRSGHDTEVIDWLEKHKNDEWFVKAAVMFANIIDNLPSY